MGPETSEGRTVPREKLPSRRHCWSTRLVIGGQALHITFGEFPDGRLGEVFVDCSKQGTFLRGILTSMARLASLALQCGAAPGEVAKVLRNLDFPPKGEVCGSRVARQASSVADLLAQEIEAAYVTPPAPPPEKVAGYISQSKVG